MGGCGGLHRAATCHFWSHGQLPRYHITLPLLLRRCQGTCFWALPTCSTCPRPTQPAPAPLAARCWTSTARFSRSRPARSTRWLPATARCGGCLDHSGMPAAADGFWTIDRSSRVWLQHAVQVWPLTSNAAAAAARRCWWWATPATPTPSSVRGAAACHGWAIGVGSARAGGRCGVLQRSCRAPLTAVIYPTFLCTRRHPQRTRPARPQLARADPAG